MATTDLPRVRVAVDAPVRQPLSYAVPAGLEVAPGSRVQVPLGRRQVQGVVLGPDQGAAPARLKALTAVLDQRPAVPADVLAMAEFAARYYHAGPGELLRAALPPGMQRQPTTRLRLTERGRRLLEVELLSGLGEAEAEALRALAGADRSRRGLRQTGVSAAVLDRLVAEQLIEAFEPRARTEVQTRAFYTLAADRSLAEIPPQARQMRAVASLLARERGLAASAVETALPGGRAALKRLEKRGLVVRVEHARDLPALETLGGSDHRPPIYSDEQQGAVDAICAALERGEPQGFLLHGVTSSGKTEVYLAAAARALELGRGVLVLVPEIALTPQLVGRFERRLDAAVEVLHSGLPDSERRQRWSRVRDGAARCVIGARSAVFAPVQDLGLLVVDEEHDSSYKQDDSPRYHARDLAIWRAHHLGCPIVLGSATPSFESLHRTEQGALQRLRLANRVGGARLPEVEVVPLTPGGVSQASAGEDLEIFTPPLLAALEKTLGAGEQAILFLNRRGFAHFVICVDCGEIAGCPDCSVSLTHHRAAGALVCHYCGHRAAIPERCPRCQGERVVPFGLGTERLEAELQRHFPAARIGRVDRDSTRRRGALVELLERFASRELDVLVGTQMLAKGHDYPGVTLVGVMVADVGLAVADFRAAERTYQLLAQVSGRAGRGSRPGRVLIQAFDAGHPAVVAAQTHAPDAFIESELEMRRLLNYPPFGRLAVVRLEDRDGARAEREANALVRQVRDRLPGEIELLGPAPAPLAKLRGVHRVQVLVKAPGVALLQRALWSLQQAFDARPSRASRLVFDVDPALVL